MAKACGRVDLCLVELANKALNVLPAAIACWREAER